MAERVPYMNRLRELRERANPQIELYDISHHLRVTVSTVRRWDNNEITIPAKHIPEVARLVKADPSYLMGWDSGQVEQLALQGEGKGEAGAA